MKAGLSVIHARGILPPSMKFMRAILGGAGGRKRDGKKQDGYTAQWRWACIRPTLWRLITTRNSKVLM